MSHANIQCIFVISGILLFAGAVYLNLIITNKKLLKREYINHSKQWKTKAVTCLPCVACFSAAIWQTSWWWPASISILLVMAWFFLMFDGLFGWKVANDFFYTGSAKGKAHAKTDTFLQSMPRVLHIALKLFLCFITTYMYVVFFD